MNYLAVPVTTSQPYPLQCLPAQLAFAVPSPATVVYSCPRGESAWTPGTFELTLEASAGTGDCIGQGSGTAVVTITKSPAVNVTAPPPVTICETYEPDHVDVTFDVTAVPNSDLSLPTSILASDGRNCTTNHAINREWCRAQALCINAISWCISHMTALPHDMPQHTDGHSRDSGVHQHVS